MTELAWSVLTGICSLLATSAFTAIYRTMRSMHKRQKAEDLALEAILRRMIIEAYAEHVVDSAPMSLNRKQEIEDMSEAYFGLGGNGTAKRQVEELMQVKPTLAGYVNRKDYQM